MVLHGDGVQTADEFVWSPPQGISVPSFPREDAVPRPLRRPRLDITVPQNMTVDSPGTPNTPTGSRFPIARPPLPPAQTASMDEDAYFPEYQNPEHTKRTLVSQEDIQNSLSHKLIEMKRDPDDEEALQKICFDLIRECRLTWEVYQVFQKRFKPKSFSRIKWTDVAPTIRNLPEIQPNTYLRIPAFPLIRTRMPWNMFERLVVELDRSVLRVGKQAQLVNEAGVHEYIRPVFDFFIDEFSGGVINTPELTLEGGTSSSGGRCEYNFVFLGSALLVLVELKFVLDGKNDVGLSNIVAQVFAECASLHNQFSSLDRVPIHAILTDGCSFYFFVFDFKNHTAYRGVTSETEGYYSHQCPRITLPSEDNLNYLVEFKGVAETIFHVFLHCYLNATIAIMGQFRRDYGINAMFSKDVVSYREAYNELYGVIRQLREANRGRETPDAADSIAHDALERLHDCLSKIPHRNPNRRLLLNQMATRRNAIWRA